MDFTRRKKALEIISQCDCLTLTEDDKMLIIAAFAEIFNSLDELGGITTEMKVRYEILKISTWSNGYFCTSARQLCNFLYPVINLLAKAEE